MEALIKMVAEKTGISTEQATTAVDTVMGFVKDKLPGGFGDQLESLLGNADAGSLGDLADGLKDKLGGFFGK